ncbi:lysosome membrane protein 2-like isoform X2 [Artemia franciscana]|uniref:lysosome membrane protein 2-like isoform X2 n=1 Tax=Artemia franciscana TaxID=6661 RepID=UPI0032D9B9B2
MTDKESKSDTKPWAWLCSSILAIIGVLFLVMGILSTMYFSSMIDAFIQSEMLLYNNTRTFPMWRKPPVNPIMKVYFFNVTNQEDILQGEKPILEEIGPFTYIETWEKVISGWNHKDGTVSYEIKKTFVFSRQLSVGSENENITLPNIPVITAASQTKYGTKLVRKATSALLKTLNQGPFSTQTVNEWLWGFDHALVKLGKDIMPPENQPPFDRFGLLIGKNDTPASGLYTVYTGRNDITKYATVHTWNNQSRLNFWKTDSCNMINGTDGTAFPPDVSKNTTLEMFNPELCRPIPLTYRGKVERNGVEAYKFSPPDNVFDPPSMVPEHDCYCPEEGCSLPRGVFNVSICNYGAPIAVSFPHFYNADEKLLEEVIGLAPEKEKHEFYMDVQPKMGIGIAAKGRIQINLMIPEIEDIQQMVGVPPIIFPVFWFESGIDGLPDSVSQELKLATQGTEVIKNGVCYGLFAIGGLLLLTVAIIAVRREKSQKYAAKSTEMETRNGDSSQDTFVRIGSGKVEGLPGIISGSDLSEEQKL